MAAVLTEAVANAWDADAQSGDIRINTEAGTIVFADAGIGMTIEDMNKKYLRVGYRRREEHTPYGKSAKKGRLVMGRKGLGKMSPLALADLIEALSAKDGPVQVQSDLSRPFRLKIRMAIPSSKIP